MTPPLFRRLADVCEVVQGGRHGLTGNDFVTDGYPAFGAGGVNGKLPSFEFDRSAVILSAIGARCGKCFYAQDKWSSLANTQVILPKPEIADARFLWFQLNDEKLWPRSGTAQPFIKPSDVKSKHIYLPLLSEQRRIAAVLDQADGLRGKRWAALAKLDELARAIFVAMFGNPSIGTSKWPLMDFAATCHNEDAKRIPVKLADRENRIGQYPYYGASGVIDSVDNFIFEGPRLLVAEDGANLLSRSTPIAFLASGKFWVNNHAHVLRFSGVAHLRYLRDVLLHLDVSPYVTGSAQPKLNKTSLDRIKIPVPPLDCQQRYIAVCAKLDLIKETALEQHEILTALFTSLQHRAFAGEL